jgi:hypothetical protein
MKLSSWRMTVSLAILGLAAPVAFWFRAEGPLRDPHDALHEFFYPEGTVAEDMLMDPLILCGSRVVPLVLDAVKDKEMIHRRYAIGFLGNEGDDVAIPTLDAVLSDLTELDYFREDALEAIYMIDRETGAQAARRYAASDGSLGRAARDILDGKAKNRRSFLEALTGAHDVCL